MTIHSYGGRQRRYQPAFARLFQRWKVNAPKMTKSIPLERIENNARGNTLADAGLDHIMRGLVMNKTPDRPHQSCITIIPILEALRSRLDPLRFQFSYHFPPRGAELRSQFARPRDAYPLMKPTFPIVVGFVLVLRPTPLAPVCRGVLDPRPSLCWAGQ
jgi:hypothetical protein